MKTGFESRAKSIMDSIALMNSDENRLNRPPQHFDSELSRDDSRSFRDRDSLSNLSSGIRSGICDADPKRKMSFLDVIIPLFCSGNKREL